MYRYLTINSWVTSILSGLIVSMLVAQAITPTIVYGMEESAATQEQTDTETTPAEEVAVASVVLEEADVELIEEPEETNEEEETPTESDPATITTGDAVAGTEVENEINLTKINTEATSSASTTEETMEEKEDPENAAVILEEDPLLENFGHSPEPENTDSLTISATNTATSTTNATTTATTGENAVSGNSATINTGDAVAYTDVLNVVNTNIVNSDGLVKFVNEALGYQDFDLRDEFDLTYAEFDTAQTTPNCNLDACTDGTDTTIDINNNATIDNNIVVEANTGNNQAAGDGSAINTGDAYASANVINVANTNITDSNYLLLVFNNFSSYAGDIVLPNSDFFDRVLQNSGGVSDVDLNINNSATINNNVETVADSGNNTATGDSSAITTGFRLKSTMTTCSPGRMMPNGKSFW